MTTKLYPLRTQLNTNSGTQGDDCGPITIINVMRWASDNKIAIHQSQAGEWVKKIRKWANKPRGGFLLAGDCLQVYNHPEFKKCFTDVGYNPPVPTYHYRKSWYKTLFPRLKRGEAAHIGVDYGVLRAGKAPTGSSTFSEGHYVLLLNAGLSGKSRSRMVWDGDPLFDGRRDFPKGWQRTHASYFKAAAGAWGVPILRPGLGRFTGITLQKGGKR